MSRYPIVFQVCFLWLLLMLGGSSRLLAANWALEGEFQIILPEQASASEQFAAEELKTYLEKLSEQADVTIRRGGPPAEARYFLIGRHPLNRDLWEGLNDPDQSVIEGSDQCIRIVGGYLPEVSNADGQRFVFDWGVLYGVYQFLEEQGVRWFRPEKGGEHLPQWRTQLVFEKKARHYRPAFPLRWGYALYSSVGKATEEEKTMATLWAVRNRINTNLPLQDPRYGGCYRILSGHSYARFVPPSLFKEHPDYFALVNGQRVPDRQLCLSNPELQAYFTRAVMKLLDRNPQLRQVSIDPNDHGGWCECASCQAMDDPATVSAFGEGRLSMSSRVFTFSSIIAERVAKAHPKVDLICLAYAQYTEAPMNLSGALSGNLVVGVAPFEAAYSDWSHALRDPQSAPNRRFLQQVEGFQKLGLRLYGREYFSYYGYRGWPGPLPMLRVMKDRLLEYQKLGFLGIYNETHPTWGPQGLDLYMATRLLNRPDLDLKAALTEYCELFYGPAATVMQRYHEMIEQRADQGPYYGSGGAHAGNLFTRKFLSELAPLVAEARHSAQGKEPYAWRVGTVLAGYEFAKRYREAMEAMASADYQEAKRRVEEVERYYCDHYPDGDVFDKRDGRYHRNADGSYRLPRTLGDLYVALERMRWMEKQFRNPRILQNLDQAWSFATDPEGIGIKEKWYDASTDAGKWAILHAGLSWQRQGYDNYTGIAWYSRTFPAPKLDPGQRMILAFGGIDGSVGIWLNGVKLGSRPLIDEDGENHWDTPLTFDITSKVAAGINRITLRVVKDIGHGGLHRHVRLLKVDEEADVSHRP